MMTFVKRFFGGNGEQKTPMGHFLIRALIVGIVALIVLVEMIASVLNAVDWGVLLSLLPDWLVPDVMLELVTELKAPEQVTAPTMGCTEVRDGTLITLICEHDMRFPIDDGGAQ